MKEALTRDIIKPSTDFNVQQIRKDFPILDQKINGNQLVYLDNAATSQKPRLVIDAISNYYQTINSNVHRGAHHLSAAATDAYENARTTVQQFIHAKDPAEINFTRGTTEAINLVAHSFGRKFIQKNDEVLLSAMEHHSNIVPWQMLCEAVGAKLRVIPVTAKGSLDLTDIDTLLTNQTKLVAIVHTSNSLGTVNPVREIIKKAHAVGAKVLLDCAQAAPHTPLDVQALDCDFLCFSGHKLFGPTGIGVLYGKRELLEQMPPYQGGGEMIKSVSFKKTTYNVLPYKFEAGTPNISGAIGLATAIEYVNQIGFDKIRAYEQVLLQYATEKLEAIEGLHIVGTTAQKASVISFNIEGIHPFDIGTLLDQQGIAVRTGHHCCQPLMDFFQIEGTCRASFSFYNTLEEVESLVKGIERAVKMLK